MRRAKLAGELQLVVRQVHRDYRVRPDDGGGANRRKAHSTDAEHRHRLSRADTRRIQDRTGPGQNSAADYAGDVRGVVLRHLDYQV